MALFTDNNRPLNVTHALCMTVLKLGSFKPSNTDVTLLNFG